LRVFGALGLWISLIMFLMAAMSLRRFTTPAEASGTDDASPSVTAPSAAPEIQTAVPRIDPTPASTPQPRQAASQPSKEPSVGVDSPPPIQGQQPALHSGARAVQASGAQLAQAYGRLPLSFESNKGQTDARVKFLAHGTGYTVFLTDNEAVLALEAKKKAEGKNRRTLESPALDIAAQRSPASRRPTSQELPSTTVVRMKLVSANRAPQVAGVNPLPGRSNYFIGRDPSKWQSGVPTYAKVRYQDVYPGVDLVYYGNQRQLEYDFIVAPGADPKAIGLEITGASGKKPLDVDPEGNLVVHLTGGEVRFHKPVVYQTDTTASAVRHLVDGRYTLKGKEQVAFTLASYDASKPLVIDPTLSYSTYLGGSGFDAANAIAVDSSGDAYVAGFTGSSDFPPGSITGACVAPCGSSQDAFVLELKPDGSALVYSTYLGGSGTDVVQGIAVDSSGNAYVTGDTDSSDFPQVNPIASACVGCAALGQNAFVTEIEAGGAGLQYSTLLGGSSTTTGRSIAVDSSGNAYVAGHTLSTDFPQTSAPAGACAGKCGSGGGTLHDAFVTEVKASGAGLQFSTLLGGSGDDQAFGVALDSSSNIYVTGLTTSTDFPKQNAIAAACNGATTCGTGAGEDAFVTELGASGSSVLFSTYLGGSGTDEGLAVAVDSSGAVYVTGDTSSTDFPAAGTVSGACADTCGSGVTNAYVTKLKTDGSGLAYSTYLGGNLFDVGLGIAVDSSGSASVTGFTMSSDFPAVSAITGACAGACGNGTNLDAFVTQVNAAGSGLAYSMFLGGSGTDAGFAIAVDSNGHAYVAGQTSSTDFKTTAGVLQPTCGTDALCNSGAPDGFVAQIFSGPAVSLSGNPLSFGNQLVNTVSGVQTVTLTNTGTGTLTINTNGITVSGQFALATTGTSCPYAGGTVNAGANCTIDVTFDPTTAGPQSGSVSIADNAGDTPQSFNLSGTATAPAVTFLPGGSMSFGSVQLGSSSGTQSVTLVNTGNGNLNITSISISGDFAFGAGNTCAAGTVTPLSSCTIAAVFTPTALGARAGSVTVADNVPGSASQTVTLAGTGIDTIAPAVTTSASPQLIQNRNGAFVPVTVSGMVIDSGSGVKSASGAYTVKDEYGLVQPSGTFTVNLDGSYTFVVLLQASRLGSDADGRQYTITVSAQDNAGNTGSASVTVTVLHNS
jgi:beta-propeller repeat-containing protein/ASPM-SPD-2-Hydin domain-containing protein